MKTKFIVIGILSLIMSSAAFAGGSVSGLKPFCNAQEAQESARELGLQIAMSIYNQDDLLPNKRELGNGGVTFSYRNTVFDPNSGSPSFNSETTIINASGKEITGYTSIQTLGQWKQILINHYLKELPAKDKGYFVLGAYYDEMMRAYGLNRFKDSDSINTVFGSGSLCNSRVISPSN